MLLLINLLSLFVPPLAGFFASLYSRFWAAERSYVEYRVQMPNENDQGQDMSITLVLRARGTRNISCSRAYVYVDGEGSIASIGTQESNRRGMKARSFPVSVDSADRKRAILDIPLLYPNETFGLSLQCDGKVSSCWIETCDDPELAEPLNVTKWADRISSVGILVVFAMWGVAGYLIFQGGMLKWIGWALVAASFAVGMVAGAIAPEEEGQRERRQREGAVRQERRSAREEPSDSVGALPSELAKRLARANSVVFLLVLAIWAAAGLMIYDGGLLKWVGWVLVAMTFAAITVAFAESQHRVVAPHKDGLPAGNESDDR